MVAVRDGLRLIAVAVAADVVSVDLVAGGEALSDGLPEAGEEACGVHEDDGRVAVRSGRPGQVVQTEAVCLDERVVRLHRGRPGRTRWWGSTSGRSRAGCPGRGQRRR